MATEPIDDENPIEEILLNGFPNPDRVGCPAPEVIEALGQKKLGRDDPAWRHIWNCSPCFRDFKTIRDKRLAQLERQQQATYRNKWALAIAAAAVAVAAIVGLLLRSSRSVAPAGQVAVVAIDLSNAGTVRGAQEDQEKILAKLPNKLDEIHLTLPRMSPQGRYVVAILESKSQNTAVALGSAVTDGGDTNTSLSLKLDLASTKPGRYYLATRREEQGQQEAAYYYPVLVGQQ